MDWTRSQGRIAALVLVAASGLVLTGLASFGIWDPWELASADLARQVASDGATATDRPPLTTALIARGFGLGVHEWSGRLPMALAGLLAVALAYALVARFAGRRAGVWAALITATSPLFLLNARQMLGASPAMAASGAVFLCAAAAVFRPARVRTATSRQWLFTALWLLGMVVSTALATLASGVLLGVAPPLLAVGAAALARGELSPPWKASPRSVAASAVLVAALIASAGAAHAVWADYAGFGLWTGGVPRGGDPPSWEMALERVFHSFAPWSALLPIALARMLLGAPREPSPPPVPRPGGPKVDTRIAHPYEGSLRLAVVAWVAFGFLAQTVYTARYGPATFLPVIGAAAAVALLVRDVERTKRSWWGTGLVAFLFLGLVVRDYRAYPGSPIAGLPAEGIEVPEVFNPAARWAVVLGLFGVLALLGLAADPKRDAYPMLREDFRDLARRARTQAPTLAYAWLRLGVPIELLRTQWRRGVGFAAWIVFFATLLLAIVVAGVICWALPELLTQQLGLTSLAVRIGRLLPLVVPGVVLLILGGRLALFLFGKLGSYRFVPALVAGLVVGAYVSLGFQPALSSHFSPREVYDTYAELAAPGEPLGEFRVGGRAAAYYATGEIQELDSQAALLDFLRQDRRVWVTFRADDLASINREYRRRENRHLFVADARSARMILATNRPVDGMPNQNYLADAVLDEPPQPQHPVSINFDNRVELLGIDLDLPHGSYVGPGEAFRITWYFRVLAPVGGSYQPFVHIDGPGQRINGDHEPVEGRYPVRLWEPGDIIVDRQELRVPANYQRGNLTIYMGFYSGETRLEIVSGPKDEVNRGRAGILPIR